MTKHLNISEIKELVLGNIQISESGCWLWKGAKDKHGYGTRRIGPKGDNKNWFAHRLSAMVFLEDYSEDLQANHHCDVKGCVNPDHLYMGTQAQNMADVRTRGITKGKPKVNLQSEKHPRARLNVQAVNYLRECKSKGLSLKDIWRKEFSNVSYSTIIMAARGGNWKYV